MKKFFAFVFIVGSLFRLNAQDVELAWFVNPGLKKIDESFSGKLRKAEVERSDFAVISGKIAFEESVFPELKKTISGLELSAKVLPDYSDILDKKAFLSFFENFEEKRFLYVKGNKLFLGINSKHAFEPEFGFFAREDLFWLEDELQTIKKDGMRAFLFTDFPPEKIANFYELENLLEGMFFETVFLPETPEIISKNFYFIFPKEKRGEAKIKVFSDKLLADFGGSVNFEQKFKNKILSVKGDVPALFEPAKDKLNLIWRQALSSANFQESETYKGRIYAAQNDGLLTCIDADGSVFWDYDMFGDAVSAPRAIDGFLVAATLQGDLILLNALNGDALQTIGFESALTSELLTVNYGWEINTMSPKTSGSNAAVIFGDVRGVMRCYDVETLEKIWESKISREAITGKIYEAGNQILFISGKTLYSLDKKNGALLWKTKFEGKPDEHIAIGKRDLFVVSAGNIYSLDIQLGKLNWKNDKYRAKKIALSKNGKNLYVLDESGNFILADALKGKFIKKFPLKLAGDNFAVFSLKGVLFIAGGKDVFRINKRGKYSKILTAGFPLVFAKKYGGNGMIIGDANGNIALLRYVEKN